MTYRFDRFELQPDTEQLRKQNVLIHLSPQPFRLLLMLVMRAGEVVTREEIQQELWGSDTFVDFNQSINAAIRRIRYALNDDAETPRLLQTLPRRGYCFFAPVERVEVGPPPPTPFAVATSLTVAPPPPPEKSPQKEKEATQAHPVPPERAPNLLLRFVITVALFPVSLWVARGPGIDSMETPLRIAIAPVAFKAGASEFDAGTLEAELRSRLGQVQPERITVVDPGAPADLRIETSAWKAGERFFVDARMIDTPSARAVWSETFRRSEEATDLPLEVAVRLTRAVIERHLPRRSWQPALRSKVSEHALAAYREGQNLQSPVVLVASRDPALEAYHRALSAEPRFAEAWAAVANIWMIRTMAWSGDSRQLAITSAEDAVKKALAIDPQCAQALNARAVLLTLFDQSYDEAVAAARKAVIADPAYLDAHLSLAQVLSATGQHTEALAELHRARLLDPRSMVPSPATARLYLMARRYGDALIEYRAIQVVAPNRPGLHWDLMSAAMGAHRWDDAALALSMIAGEQVTMGRGVADRGAEFHRHLRRLAPVLAAREHAGVDPYMIAWVHAQTGNADAAFAALERSSTAPALHTMYTFVDPRFDPLRSDPRFNEQLERLGFLRGPAKTNR